MRKLQEGADKHDEADFSAVVWGLRVYPVGSLYPVTRHTCSRHWAVATELDPFDFLPLTLLIYQSPRVASHHLDLYR